MKESQPSSEFVSPDSAGGRGAVGGPSPVKVRPLKRVALGAAAFTFLVGLLVLAGWLLQLPRLTTVFAGNVPMMPLTAAGLVLAAVSLALLNRETRVSSKVGKILAVLLFVLGLVASAETLLEFVGPLAHSPLPMSPITAFSFVGLGMALLLLDARKRGAILLSEFVTVTVLLASLLGVAGYTYGIGGSYSVANYTSLAMHTAVALLVLSVGILAARPERGLLSLLTRQTSGAVLARRLLPWAFGVPLVLGWLRLRAEQAGLFELAFGTAFLTTLMVAVFVALIWRTAVSLDRTDRERQRAVDMLRESKATLDFTLESAEVGDWDLDLIHDTARRSLRHDQCFGYKEPIPEWGFETFIQHVHPEDRREIEQKFRAAVTEQKDWHFECRVIWPDGSVHWIAAHGSIYRTPEGKPARMLGIVFNITERKRAEEELRQLKDDLEVRVEQRTAELQAGNREQEAFGYTVSHDLRAPLRHIGGFIKLLDEHAGDNLDETGRRYIQVISNSAKRMGNLIDDMLILSRVGRATITATTVNLRQLVDEARRELASTTGGRAVDWQIGALPTVKVDPTVMRTAIVNLLSNAIKYSSSRNPARIEIGFEETEDEVIWFVRDNGVGFDMRFADKLFGVFQRLHRFEEFEGTGIGLASVRRIVERHGGRVWAEGAVDQGATFFFSLPKTSRDDT